MPSRYDTNSGGSKYSTIACPNIKNSYKWGTIRLSLVFGVLVIKLKLDLKIAHSARKLSICVVFDGFEELQGPIEGFFH